MIRLPFALALALLAAACRTSAPDEAALRERLAAFTAAFAAADAERAGALLADDYVHTNAGSAPIGRQQWLQYIAQRREQLASGALRLTRYENADLRIVMHGPSAVVTGTNISEGTRDGTPFSTRLRFTQVWVRTPSGWKRAAFHDAPAGE